MPWVLLIMGVAVVELGWRDANAVQVDAPGPAAAASTIGRLRAAPTTAIDDAGAAAIVSGVTFGRTEHISAADQQLFLSSGLWHLLAASGQNIALVAACCILMARALGQTKVVGSVLALAAIPAYVFVVGGGASIVRAGIMGELAVVAWLLGVLAETRHLIVLTAAGLCWCWPGAHRGLGMQLSFACVAGLAWWATPATRWLVDRGVPTWLAGGLVASVVCGLVTAPILVLRTGAAPVSGTLANLLAVPLAGMILVVGLGASLVATFLPDRVAPVAQLGFDVAALAARLLHGLAERGAALPMAQTSSRALAIGVPLAALAWWVAPRLTWARPGVRRWLPRIAGGVILACSAVSIAPGLALPLPGGGDPPSIAAGTLRIAVLDIGQGDATLLATDEAAVLIDTGPPDGQVVRRVRAMGVSRLDGIVLTHDSLDHRGGYDAALTALHPAWVAKGRDAPGNWKHVMATAPRLIDLCAGSTLQLEPDVTLRILNPTCDGHITPRTTDLHNDGAMVTLIEHGAVRVVVPADAEAPVLVRLALPQLDLLRISHHGSSDPQLPALLDAVHPQLAAISVGAGNSYGHPRGDTLDALTRAGVPTFRTDRDGSLAFDSDGRRLVLW
ncbi:MAG: ComEC/Rec2 family competence protein [Thermoleophilia bacterium]|nr:ComEC/Rec2 family competence protein [Thermoleophilia bacterium]